MKKDITYIGLDVDDKAFHGSVLNPGTGEVLDFKCHPTVKSLNNQLNKVSKLFGHDFKICYEATHIAFTLQRELSKLGYHCDVIAPSSIPRVKGNCIKTDRIDARKLAEFYANGLLTMIDVPGVEQEQDRDLLRSRQYIQEQRSHCRRHLQSLLRRNNLHYKQETNGKSHWTQPHMHWIQRKIDAATGSFKTNLSLLFQQVKWLDYTLLQYNEAVDDLAETEIYKEQVQALIAYKGIKNIFAMVMITEIGNIERFDHPRKLVSWIGMDIREYSSGGKHHRFGITKQGNRYLRCTFVESNQRIFRSKIVSKDLARRRKGTDPEAVLIADRCMLRIYKKGQRLLHAGKHVNKVKVACAREMVGFVWESLKKVA